MTHAQLFAATLIVLALGAAGAYGREGDWRRAVYWLAAAVRGGDVVNIAGRA